MIRGITILLLVAVAINSVLSRGITRAGCSVSVNNHLGDPQALILKPGVHEGTDAYFWPQNNDIISFDEGEVVVLACPGGVVNVKGSSTGLESAEATCESGSFTIEGKTVLFSNIYCSRLPFHTARYTGNTCLDTYKEIEVGFELEDGRFIQDMIICFDNVKQNSAYTQFTMTKNIEGYQSGFPRPNFIEDDFYNVGSSSVDNLYSRNNQRATVNKLVGLSSGSTKYIATSSDYFMSRGHLAAKADWVYGAQQRFTFHLVNIAPQWQTFNGANWNNLEMSVRTFVGNSDSDIVVYTGTHGVTTLPHEETGEDIELWLYVDGDKKGLPAPLVYWKVLYDPESKAAIAFVGVNNPYHSNEYIEENEVFCNSICDMATWVNWKNPTDNSMGYSYCCEVDELRKTIANIPEFEVNSILS